MVEKAAVSSDQSVPHDLTTRSAKHTSNTPQVQELYVHTQILARSQTLRECLTCMKNISMNLTRSIRHGGVTFAVVGTNIPGSLQTITVEPNLDVNKAIGSKQMPFCDPCIHVLTLFAVQFSETFQLDHSISTNQSCLTQSILITYWMQSLRKLTVAFS